MIHNRSSGVVHCFPQFLVEARRNADWRPSKITLSRVRTCLGREAAEVCVVSGQNDRGLVRPWFDRLPAGGRAHVLGTAFIAAAMLTNALWLTLWPTIWYACVVPGLT